MAMKLSAAYEHASSVGSEGDYELWWLVVRDAVEWRKLGPIEPAVVMAIVASISDDPQYWSDIRALWPRYCQEEIACSLDDLPGGVIAAADAFDWIEEVGGDVEFPLIVLDLAERRILIPPSLDGLAENGWCKVDVGPPVGDANFQVDESASTGALTSSPAQEQTRINMHFAIPPWWSTFEEEPVSVAFRRPVEMVSRPQAHREILWGPTLCEYFAEALVAALLANPVELLDPRASKARYSQTVAIHRAWLMTERSDLGQRTPRAILHQAKDWVQRVIEGMGPSRQHPDGLPPITMELSTFHQTPLGPHEIIGYFHACRHLLDHGWESLRQWADSENLLSVTRDQYSDTRDLRSETERTELVERLSECLRKELQLWLVTPGTGFDVPSLTPAEIIQRERHRVPLIENESDCEDPNCPMCRAMAAGLFGPATTHFDGLSLDSDYEFAFSLISDYDDWYDIVGCWADGNCDLDDDEDDDDENDLDDDVPVGQRVGIDDKLDDDFDRFLSELTMDDQVEVTDRPFVWISPELRAMQSKLLAGSLNSAIAVAGPPPSVAEVAPLTGRSRGAEPSRNSSMHPQGLPSNPSFAEPSEMVIATKFNSVDRLRTLSVGLMLAALTNILSDDKKNQATIDQLNAVFLAYCAADASERTQAISRFQRVLREAATKHPAIRDSTRALLEKLSKC